MAAAAPARRHRAEERLARRGDVGPDYGYLWWLNTEGRAWPDAPRTAYRASGHGSNTVWVDPEHDLVVVWRWHQGRASNEFYKRIIASIGLETTDQALAAVRP